MSVSIQYFPAATGSKHTIVLVEKCKRAFNQRKIRGDIGICIVLCFQYHVAELENRIPFVFQPGIIFQSLVEPLRTLEAIFRRIRQTEILYLFTEAGPIMLPINTAAQFCIFQHPVIEIKLGMHHVVITAFQHRPIYQPLVLCGHCPAPPFPVVGSKRLFLIYMTRIEGK